MVRVNQPWNVGNWLVPEIHLSWLRSYWIGPEKHRIQMSWILIRQEVDILLRMTVIMWIDRFGLRRDGIGSKRGMSNLRHMNVVTMTFCWCVRKKSWKPLM